MKLKYSIAALALCMANVMAIASPAAKDDSSEGQVPLWLRKSAISPDGKTVAFAYQGDIFTVPATGGKAVQITTNPAYDSDPMWTADGKKIVFTSTREGSKDIFITSAEGGVPKRVTDYPGGETPLCVLEDGTILFTANIQAAPSYIGYPGSVQLYGVSQEGGRPRRITSLPMGAISVNAAGAVLYEDIKGYEDPLRKHHTSSVTRDIWLCTPGARTKKEVGTLKIDSSCSFTKLSTFKGEDRNPVFAPNGEDFYCLSEQDGSFNIYKSSLSSPDKSTRITYFDTNPVRYVSVAQDGTLCFSYDGELYTVKEGAPAQKLAITIVKDCNQREKVPTAISSMITSFDVSPDGKEVALVARGDVYVTSVEYSTTRRITDTPEQERGVCFSKDGRTLYYAAERDGEWGIWETSLADKNDKNFTYSVKFEEKRVTPVGQTCFQMAISPDGESLAYLRDRTELVVRNLKTGKEKSLLKGANYSYTDGDQDFEWSPDSKWILCNYQADGGWNNEDVALVNVKTGEVTNLTESGYSDGSFRWALKGKAMIWQSDRAGFRSHGSWGAERDVYAMFFDGAAYRNFTRDKEYAEMEKGAASDKKKCPKDTTKAEKKVEELVLDLENRADRIVRLTRFSGRLGDSYLTNDGAKLYYVTRQQEGFDLCVMDIRKKTVKVAAKSTNGSFVPSADGKYIYMVKSAGITRIDTSNDATKSITFSGEYDYRPALEREYIFNHIWKQVLEKFYDPMIHGIDWEAYKEIYAKFLPYITNNYDFQEMLSELLGELNGSHTGARYYPAGQRFGTLGVIYDDTWTGDGLKIAEVLKGGVLAIADSEIAAGDVITKIDGKPILAGESWYELLRNKAGKKIIIAVEKGGKKEVEIHVTPAYSDHAELYKRWVRRNEQLVEKLSGGKVAYVHVQGMNSDSFREVYSKLLGKYRTAEAVIVDTRHNGGGWLHDDLATLLSGCAYVRYEPRGQYIGTDPYNKWNKPSCVLMGEDNYSDACGFPYVYKSLGIGKLIGAPVPGTMTAVWWETQIDNSLVFGIPQVGAMGVKEGRYLENMQIEPDILVYNDPAGELSGVDRQLEAAVAEMMKVIENK